MQCSLLKVNRRFGRTYHLSLDCRIIKQAMNQHEVGSGRLFIREEGGEMFFRNFGLPSAD
jgi:hypothetical protein